jgi:ABC-type uncharacterized transport system substrate-binding protein
MRRSFYRETQARLTAFRQRLKALGWIEGRNVEIIARFGATDPARNRTYVAELLGLTPDAVVSTNPPSISALMKETRTIPIVFPIKSDPVELGFAESLASSTDAPAPVPKRPSDLGERPFDCAIVGLQPSAGGIR